MNLLAAALYDPAVAVSKATTALLAMTALDTTNLRLSVTVPAHGKVHVRLACTVHGGTTFPVILLGVLEGATVRGRAQPGISNQGAGAAQMGKAEVEFTITGLSAGTVNWDAAYAVQGLVASSNIKYGGPNDNVGNDAFGAFVFEVWDPQPLTTGLGGQVNVGQWLGTNVTAATAGVPDVNTKNINNVTAATPGAANGILISGSNAGTTTFGALTVTGTTTMSDGLVVNRSTANSDAITATGSGSGSGLVLAGGAASGATPAGHGLKATGGTASSTALGVAGNAIRATGGSGAAATNGAAVGVTMLGGAVNTVASAAFGLDLSGASTGGGLKIKGGAGSTGAAVAIVASATNAAGIEVNGNGSGNAITLTPGATGIGLQIFGGATSGDAIDLSTTAGHGIDASAIAGASKYGLNATLGANAIAAVSFAADTAQYHANIEVTRDTANSRDEYTITWYKNASRITAGITSPTIQVVKRVDGTDLVAATAMSQIGTTGSYKYDESTNKLTLGEAAVVVVTATIDGATRDFSAVVTRDG